MAKKLTVVSKTITSMTEPWCDTTAGTCHDFLDVEEFLKAKLNETSTSLSSKADTTAINDLETTLNNKLANKADLSAVSSAISNKADKSAVTALENTVSQKANSSDVTTALAKKADSSDVASALAKKADASALDLKANKSDVISREELDTKADKSEVISKTDLALKADKAEVEEALATKAGIFYNDEEGSRVLVFADEASKDAYLANTSNVDLILGVINASTGSGSGGGGEVNESELISSAEKATFIELCRMYGVTYNKSTGYFELNGLTDITVKEMKAIYAAGIMTSDNRNKMYVYEQIRTHMPPRIKLAVASCERSFFGSTVEVVNIPYLEANAECFKNCSKLKKAVMYSPNHNKSDSFMGCSALETLTVSKLYATSISFKDSPLLSLASFQNLIDKAITGTEFTITVHPSIYAKITDATNYPEWAALVQRAASRNALITFATTEELNN